MNSFSYFSRNVRYYLDSSTVITTSSFFIDNCLINRFAEIEKMGFEREDEVIGLMMYLGDDEDLELVEHLLVKNRSKCFDMKRIAEESSNAYYECARIKAIVKDDKIISVIKELEVL